MIKGQKNQQQKATKIKPNQTNQPNKKKPWENRNPGKCWSYNFSFSGMSLRLCQINLSIIQLNTWESTLDRKTTSINYCNIMWNTLNYSDFKSLLSRVCQNLLCAEGILLSWNFMAEFWCILYMSWWNNVVCQSNAMSFVLKSHLCATTLVPRCLFYIKMRCLLFCRGPARDIGRKCGHHSRVGCF